MLRASCLVTNRQSISGWHVLGSRTIGWCWLLINPGMDCEPNYIHVPPFQLVFYIVSRWISTTHNIKVTKNFEEKLNTSKTRGTILNDEAVLWTPLNILHLVWYLSDYTGVYPQVCVGSGQVMKEKERVPCVVFSVVEVCSSLWKICETWKGAMIISIRKQVQAIRI